MALKCADYIILFAIVFFSFIRNEISAQVFHHLNEDNGLPTNFCNDIAQDSSGFIWIATDAGLTRFDGHHCKVYQTDKSDSTSISNNAILSIHVGPTGKLWASANDGIMNLYNQVEDCFTRIHLFSIDSIPDRRIYDILQVDSFLWMAAEVGLIQLNINHLGSRVLNPRNIIKTTSYGYLQTVYALHQDQYDTDILWVGTRAGLVRMKKSTLEMTFATKYVSEVPDRGQYAIKIIHQESKHKLWIGGSWTGIKSYNTADDHWTYNYEGYYPFSVRRNDIRGIIPNGNDEYWVASYVNGFGIFNKAGKSYSYFQYAADNKYSAPAPPITKIISDIHENIWIAGHNGVSYFSPKEQKINQVGFPTRQIPHSLTHTYASDFEKLNENEYLISTLSGDGLYKANIIDGSCTLINQFKGIDFKTVVEQQTEVNFYDLMMYDLLRTSDDSIWVSVDTQMAYFHIPTETLIFPPETNTPFLKSCRIRYLQKDSKGFVWGNRTGPGTIFKCHPTTFEVLEKYSWQELLPEALGEDRKYGIRSFYIDQHDIIWYHVYRRVLTFNPNNGEITILPYQTTEKPGVSGLNFYHITAAEDGTIILPANENGVQLIYPHAQNAKDSFQLLTLADGLPIEKTILAAALNNDIWVNSRKGLVNYNMNSGWVETYDQNNGLSHTDLLNYWAPSIKIFPNGHLFFGGPDHFNWMNTNEISKNVRPLKTRVTRFQIKNSQKHLDKNISQNRPIRLKANENFFTIHYASDQYINPKDQRFQYKLEGYDDDWVNAGNVAEAVYTKVPGGRYTFIVKEINNRSSASNHEGDEVDPYSINIYVATLFFQSTLFYLILLGLFAMSVWALYRWRLNQIRDKQKIKSDFQVRLAEIEMSALRAQMNPHFVFNSLNSINMYILTNEPRKASRYLTKFSQLMRLILNHSKAKEVSLSDEIESISLYIEMEKLRFKKKFEFELNTNTSLSTSEIFIPPMLIQPYIENAIWHGLMPLKRVGNLIVNIDQLDKTLIIDIIDNGIGRSKAMELKAKKGVRKKSMGMKITSDRLALVESVHGIQTNVEIDDLHDNKGDARGTQVTIIIPFNYRKITSENQNPNK